MNKVDFLGALIKYLIRIGNSVTTVQHNDSMVSVLSSGGDIYIYRIGEPVFSFIQKDNSKVFYAGIDTLR